MITFSLLCLILCVGNCYVASAPTNSFSYVYNRDAEAWLRVHTEPTTWAEAVMRCSQDGAILASPTTDALADAMHSLMSERHLDRVFTGINSTLSGESGDNFRSLEGVALASIPLHCADGETTADSSGKDCAALTGAGALARVSCLGALPYFCRKEIKNKCSDNYDGSNYKWEPRTGSCYKPHADWVAWPVTKNICHREGALLAEINSKAENTVLKEIYNKELSSSNYIFLGTSKHGDKWETVNGTNKVVTVGDGGFGEEGMKGQKRQTSEPLAEVGFLRWADGEPNNAHGMEDCLSMYKDGRLNDVSCYKPAYFICEITP